VVTVAAFDKSQFFHDDSLSEMFACLHGSHYKHMTFKTLDG
jgi:hypothetical protein